MNMEQFLASFRRYLPPHWAVWVNGGRIEVRDRADRRSPLLSFDAERNSPKELFHGLPEIVGSLIHQMHREFHALRDFAVEAVAGCADPDKLAGPVVVKAKSTPISWELSEGIKDAFPGVIARKEKQSKPCPKCGGSGHVTGELSEAQLESARAGVDPIPLPVHCPTCGGRGVVPA